MYPVLLVLHSIFRWLVLGSLVCSIVLAYGGFRSQRAFTRRDDAVRHWTATIAHIQLIFGFILYFVSPVIRYFFDHFGERGADRSISFFGGIHASLMLLAVVLITIGSAMAKRRPADREKFRTMLIWYVIALVIIIIAIPWPFSSWANRPYFRYF
jgi:hypothetical protein